MSDDARLEASLNRLTRVERVAPRLVPVFALGLDLGQAFDPTALNVVERVPPTGAPMFVLDENGKERTVPPTGPPHYHVRHLERVALHTPYPAIVQHVRALLHRAPLAGHTTLVLDQTGVGAPVADMFDAAGLAPIRVTITAGDREHRDPEVYRGWHVAKLMLVSRLQSLFHAGELKIAPKLPEAATLIAELETFSASISDAGRATFGARSGAHDDLVLALAVACWWLAREERETARVVQI